MRLIISKVLLGLAGGVFLGGCMSTPLKIPTGNPPGRYTELGPGKGSAAGFMLFQVIPIGQNDRFVDAYKEAVSSQPGGTRLINPTIEEQWFWAYIMNGYVTTVSGTVVKDE